MNQSKHITIGDINGAQVVIGDNNQTAQSMETSTPEKKQILSEVAQEIQQLLSQRSQAYPVATNREKMIVVGEVADLIESQPILKAKIINILQEEPGIQALKEAINHPLTKHLINHLEDWKNEDISGLISTLNKSTIEPQKKTGNDPEMLMNKTITLSFDNVDNDHLEQKESSITAEILVNGDKSKRIGKLPPASEISKTYRTWQSAYKNIGRNLRLEVKISADVSDIQPLANSLKVQFNNWLRSQDFIGIDRMLHSQVNYLDEVRIIIESNSPDVQKLPWPLWNFLEDYRKAEIAFSSKSYRKIEKIISTRKQIRILSILGNDQGINVEEDRKNLAKIPDAQVTFLVEPKREEFHDLLWDEQGWDILCFSGHSESQENNKTGVIKLNKQDYLNLNELKNALSKAIERGLYLAIFNSCDGLGLAQDLMLIQIPQMIVMREPVPDLVAQTFLKNFLNAFTQGKSFYLAVREAREKLQILEDKCPCATWLPVIFQNPAEVPVSWQLLKERIAPIADSNPNSINPQINQYLVRVSQRLKQQGCLDIKYNVKTDTLSFNCVAKLTDFELHFKVFDMRGDAFFVFSAFPTLNFESLRQFSTQCLEYVKTKTTISVEGQILNTKVPYNICFSVAIVDTLNSATKKSVKSKNPWGDKTDVLWYEVPIVYVINEQTIYFYDEPSFWDNFQGEIVWKQLRVIIEKFLK